MFIVPTIIGTEPPCSSARKKDVERNRHSFPLTKIVAVLLFIEEIYEIYEYLFYRTYIWQFRLWGEKRSPEVAGLLLPTSLFTFVFVGPIVGVLHSLEVPNNEELGILLAVIFTFVAHRLFISDGQYLSIADKYRNETKEKQRQRMKQVWIFLAINLIWVIFCIFLFIKVIPPPSNADTSNKNPSPEYIEMLKDIRDRRAQ